MKLSYTLKQNDFLQYHLYEYSQNDFKKNRNKFVIVYAGIFLAAAIISFLTSSSFVGYFFVLIVVLIVFLVPSRLKDGYFEYNLKLVKERYKDKYDVLYHLDLGQDLIEFTSENFSRKYSLGDLSKIVETRAGYYLILQTSFVIIPKSDDIDDADVKNDLLSLSTRLNIKYHSEVDWKW